MTEKKPMKRKTIQRFSYSSEKVTVLLEQVEHYNEAQGDRKFKVYDEHGTYLGTIESGMHRASRHLFGNVAHFYKERRKWFPNGLYWNDCESQAEAIRQVISDARQS